MSDEKSIRDLQKKIENERAAAAAADRTEVYDELQDRVNAVLGTPETLPVPDHWYGFRDIDKDVVVCVLAIAGRPGVFTGYAGTVPAAKVEAWRDYLRCLGYGRPLESNPRRAPGAPGRWSAG